MKKAAVIHHTLNSPGGEATVAIETIESLHEMGYKVSLITVQKPDLDFIAKAYGKTIPVSDVYSLVPFKMNYLGIYQRLLSAISSLAVKKDVDLIINTNGEVLPYAGSEGIPQILYLHFPAALMTSSSYGNSKYQNSALWKMYFKPYQLASRRLTRQAIARSTTVLTNSQFSREAIMQVYPEADVRVLYPPVDIDRFSSAYHSLPAETRVLVVSRFSPEKHVENAIKIAGLLPEHVKFVVIGSLLPANRSYYASIEKMVNERGLGNRMTLVPNATNEELIRAMSTSTVYLHTMAGEHFGISIIEAMAAGLVPVVPSYGGCAEISPYQYHTIEEAARCIEQNVNPSAATRGMIHDIAASRYSSEQFKKRMKRYIEQASAAEHRARPASAAAAG